MPSAQQAMGKEKAQGQTHRGTAKSEEQDCGRDEGDSWFLPWSEASKPPAPELQTEIMFLLW